MKTSKKRAMTSQKASYVKKQGHQDAKEFAVLIGLSNDYQNDPKIVVYGLAIKKFLKNHNKC